MAVKGLRHPLPSLSTLLSKNKIYGYENGLRFSCRQKQKTTPCSLQQKTFNLRSETHTEHRFAEEGDVINHCAEFASETEKRIDAFILKSACQ